MPAGPLTGIVGILSLLLALNILMVGGVAKVFHFSSVSISPIDSCLDRIPHSLIAGLARPESGGFRLRTFPQ